ncbi:hypothetical protein CONCODRAFT_8672 [Conidiobolus coronatus NRRL 28638]|uniref:Uncharacterized protein n=1 Tax=Conidiobolus coronatus (strain ATCC 28846 / CBS 209.66 / NRRL 28638) TaxID=796925 RepID=A0A137P1Q2_CONC2|nr:hypothetical protein CONCODRAFT_8672 [Conidiobolus coronatus NRRL 28638]|eukprot:KXN68973.1 hypothetical protein CONCODRAFT_8672 [Conidiobolus coronatus NRRL 28638]
MKKIKNSYDKLKEKIKNMSSFGNFLLKKNKIPTYFYNRREKNLFELLSTYKNNGQGLRVTSKEWLQKGLTDTYYEIDKCFLRNDLSHGYATGTLTWQGKQSEHAEKIRKGLKFNWVPFKGEQPNYPPKSKPFEGKN